MPESGKRRVALYASTASAGGATDAVLEQFNQGEALITLSGWNEVRRSSDIGLSGRRLRPGVVETLAAAQAGQFDILVVRSLDRLARDAGLLHHLVQAFHEAGVLIALADNNALCVACANAEPRNIH